MKSQQKAALCAPCNGTGWWKPLFISTGLTPGPCGVCNGTGLTPAAGE